MVGALETTFEWAFEGRRFERRRFFESRGAHRGTSVASSAAGDREGPQGPEGPQGEPGLDAPQDALVPGDPVSLLDNDAQYVPEAPMDGNYYVRRLGQWVNLIDALQSLGVPTSSPTDGGNVTTGKSEAITDQVFDGGNFVNGQTEAEDGTTLNGGLITGND